MGRKVITHGEAAPEGATLPWVKKDLARIAGKITISVE